MKRRTYTVILSVIILLSGCMKEDTSDCVDGSELILRFEYQNEGKNLLPEYIDLIDVMLFDENLDFYTWIETSIEDLSEDNSLNLKIASGTYYFVAWGNNYSSRDLMKEASASLNLEDGNLPISNFQTADPLFYAPDLRTVSKAGDNGATSFPGFRIEVESNKSTTHTVSFMGAHHTLNVWMKGFPDVGDENLPNPIATVSNLPASYSFYLVPDKETINLSQEVEELLQDDELFGFSCFFLPHLKTEKNVILEITGYNGLKDYMYSFTIEEILETLDLQLIDGQNIVIDILIEYKGTHVEITIPGWSQNHVDGGIST